MTLTTAAYIKPVKFKKIYNILKINNIKCFQDAAGNLCYIVQCNIVCSDDLIWKVEEHLDMLWTNTWVSNTWISKVNKTTFASDMFRVFLFRSHKKFNWLLLKNLCSGYLFFIFLHWLVVLLECWIFFQRSQCFCTACVPHMDCIHTANGVCVWTWCERPISHTAHEIRLVLCVSFCATIARLSKQKCSAWSNI